MNYKITFKTFDDSVFREDVIQAACHDLSWFKTIDEAKNQALVYLQTFLNYFEEPKWIIIPSPTFKFGCFVTPSETKFVEIIVEILK